MVILFVFFPVIAGVIPFLFTTGEFKGRIHWHLLALAISAMHLGNRANEGTIYQRGFIIGLIIAILFFGFTPMFNTWGHEIYKMASKIYGERYADHETWLSLFYFTPAALASMAVNLYLSYQIPLNFLKEFDQTEN